MTARILQAAGIVILFAALIYAVCFVMGAP
jgi:hypothetical protein